MLFLSRIARFIVYSNLFISGCTVAMIWLTLYLFSNTTHQPALYGFAFTGTLCSYSFHWWLTPAHSDECRGERGDWIIRYRWVHVYLLAASLLACGYFLIRLWDHWYWLLLAGFITFLYSAPKIPHPFFVLLQKIAIGKTVFLALMWTFVTTVFPMVMTDTTGTLPFTAFTLSRFFLIYAICLIFDMLVREYDKVNRIRSLVTYLQPDAVRRLFYLSLVLAALFAVIPAIQESLMLTICQLIPVLTIAPIYNYAVHRAGDFFFYFFLDGLMAAASLILWLYLIICQLPL